MRVLLLSVLALSLCTGPAVAVRSLPDGAFNMSSHSPEFLHRLLSGRVWIYTKESLRERGRKGAVRGTFFAPDGTQSTCFFWAKTSRWYHADKHLWRIRAAYRAPARTFYVNVSAGSGKQSDQRPFYAPESGRFHLEDGLIVTYAGWIQESWPRAMADACPELALPPDLPVNERQTGRTIEAMAEQDRTAPLRHFVAPGGAAVNYRTPGGTGVALAGGPTFPKGEFAAWINGHSGQVLDNLANSIRWLPHPRFVLAPRGGRDGGTSELWWIDDRGEVVDTTRLEPSADRSRVSLVSADYPERVDYVVGYAWPMAGTGERHPAFLLTDWLSSLDRQVSIPWWEQGEAGFQFLSWGQVAATSTEGEALTGSWWWSAGKLHLRLDDGSGDPPAVYPWRELAKHVGWEIPEGWR